MRHRSIIFMLLVNALFYKSIQPLSQEVNAKDKPCPTEARLFAFSHVAFRFSISPRDTNEHSDKTNEASKEENTD